MKKSANCLLTCNAPIATVPALAGFPVIFSEVSAEHKLDWFGTLRGRLGFTVGPVLTPPPRAVLPTAKSGGVTV